MGRVRCCVGLQTAGLLFECVGGGCWRLSPRPPTRRTLRPPPSPTLSSKFKTQLPAQRFRHPGPTWNAGLKQQQQQRQQQRAAHVWWQQVLSAASLHLSVWPGEGDSFVAPGLLPEILRKSESAPDAWVTPSPPPTPLLLKNFLCQGAAGQE